MRLKARRPIGRRLGLTRPAGIGGRLGVGRAVGGRWDVRQGAEQQAEENLGAEQVDATASPGSLQCPGERADSRHRGRRRHPGQAVPHQRCRPLGLGIQHNFRAPFGLSAAALRALRVGRDHCPPQRSAQLSHRLVSGRWKYPGLDCSRLLVIENSSGFGDGPCPS